MTPWRASTPMTLVEEIESKTGQRVGITGNEHDALGKFHEQEQSPLFSVLPRELRDHIWAYCTAPFEDPSQPFAETEYYYRPGHTARLKTDTALLYTCRRVWLEANELPMLQAEHSFYYRRAAPEARTRAWLASLTDHNRENFGHLHMFVQMCFIERLTAQPGQLRKFFLQTPPRPGDFQPRLLHVTLRHTDWWYWEREEPLRLQDSWVQAILDSPDLRSTQTFKLELETLDYKVKQLKPIIERLRKLESKEFETHIVEGKPARTKFILSEHEIERKWHGPTNINSSNYEPYVDMKRLNYYGVTLTWNLRFPDIPRAFVPHLRRNPRCIQDRKNTGLSENNPPEGYRQSRYQAHYDSAFANENSHTRAIEMVNSRLQMRQRERGLPAPPSVNFHLATMFIREKGIRLLSHKQAVDVEDGRQKAFGRMMCPPIQAIWQQQGSLLKFVEDDDV